MPKLPSWIIGYGLLLVGCDALDAFTPINLGLDGRTLVCGWIGGAIMIAAGLASMQGRRSIRMTGVYIALFLPLCMAAFFAWDASVEWRSIRGSGASIQTGVALSSLCLISMLMVGIASRLMPRESIASRGYAVPIPGKRPVPPTAPVAAVREHRHSEAS